MHPDETADTVRLPDMTPKEFKALPHGLTPTEIWAWLARHRLEATSRTERPEIDAQGENRSPATPTQENAVEGLQEAPELIGVDTMREVTEEEFKALLRKAQTGDMDVNVRRLAGMRGHIVSLDKAIADAEAKVHETPEWEGLDSLVQVRKAARENLAAAEADVRDTAPAIFEQTGVKKVHDSGVTVTEKRVAQYSPSQAKLYAIEHLPHALKLDTRAFLKAVKDVPLDWITYETQLGTRIPSDLSAYDYAEYDDDGWLIEIEIPAHWPHQPPEPGPVPPPTLEAGERENLLHGQWPHEPIEEALPPALDKAVIEEAKRRSREALEEALEEADDPASV